jgi:hypothetical protein
VVWNLLSNAIKFTPRGGQVEVSVQSVGSQVQIAVRDTGQGISPSFLPHVFDRFRQADASAARLHGGLGLGLAIVRHLVELHGGTVSAESPGEGQGATFLVTLPVLGVVRPAAPTAEDAPAFTLPPEPAASVPPPPRSSLAGLRVLVVDDHADTLELVSSVLRRHGAEVTAAASTAEAQKAFGEIRPNVLLSDPLHPRPAGGAGGRGPRGRAHCIRQPRRPPQDSRRRLPGSHFEAGGAAGAGRPHRSTRRPGLERISRGSW